MYETIYDNHRIQYKKLFKLFLEYGNFNNSRVIDIGSGTGRYASLFGEQKCSLLCCLDKSIEMLKISKKKHIDSHYVAADLTKIPFRANSFDTAVMNQVIQWIDNKNLAISEIYKLLNKKGILLLNTMSYNQLNNLILMKYIPEIYQIEIKRFPSVEELVCLLNNTNFEIIAIKEICETRNYDINQLVNFAKDKATSALRL